jgi:hypothetical protein
MMPSRFCLALAALLLLPAAAFAPDVLRAEIAPGGTLRVAPTGGRVLGGGGEPTGKFLAERLGLPFEAVTYPNPRAYEESFVAPAWDIAIGPRAPAPGDRADVTPDAWLMSSVSRSGGPRVYRRRPDRSSVIKIGTIQNSPSDRFLGHTLNSAALVRLALSPKFPATWRKP